MHPHLRQSSPPAPNQEGKATKEAESRKKHGRPMISSVKKPLSWRASTVNNLKTTRTFAMAKQASKEDGGENNEASTKFLPLNRECWILQQDSFRLLVKDSNETQPVKAKDCSYGVKEDSQLLRRNKLQKSEGELTRREVEILARVTSGCRINCTGKGKT